MDCVKFEKMQGGSVNLLHNCTQKQEKFGFCLIDNCKYLLIDNIVNMIINIYIYTTILVEKRMLVGKKECLFIKKESHGRFHSKKIIFLSNQ